jgi:NAD(P)-dependent dehydrogenase (short-subunit alcohol dehydrogenase family)
MAVTAKSVLVTGATGGVGSATVRRLDELGWQVFAGARRLEAGEELARTSRTAVPVALDICDEGSIAHAREEVAARLGGSGLDALVNNAGLVVQGPVEALPSHALRRQFEVNVIGQVAVTQAFLPLLRLAGGRVVNISGAAGSVSVPMLGAISASKAALESLSDALRMELAHQGVDVSIVAPGLLRTRLHEKSTEAAHRDGYAGGEDTRRIYGAAVDRLEKTLLTAKEAPVDVAVAAIVKALSARRPAPRYVVGRDAKQLVALRLLPDRLRDRLLMWNRGLERELFESGPHPVD